MILWVVICIVVGVVVPWSVLAFLPPINHNKEHTLKIATFNCRGIAEGGKREQIEQWMVYNDIDLVALQETKSAQEAVEDVMKH